MKSSMTRSQAGPKKSKSITIGQDDEIFELLTRDHEKVADLLEKLTGSTEREAAKRRRLFDETESEIEMHATLEEECVYPILEKSDELKDIVEEARSEHEKIRTNLHDVRRLSADETNWLEAVTKLKQTIEHYVKEEEGEMFEKMRKELDESKLDEMARQFKQGKRSRRAA